MAARGKGTVTLDRKLDLKVNGGPVEKVQALLGKEVGGMIGKVTDKILSYRITGEVGQPKVSVEVGGGSVVDTTKKIGNTLTEGATKVGQGVGKIGESLGQGLDSIIKDASGK